MKTNIKKAHSLSLGKKGMKGHERIKNVVKNVVRSYVRNPEDRKDITQDIYVDLYTHFNCDYKEKGRMIPWVRTIAIHDCINVYRALVKRNLVLTDYCNQMSIKKSVQCLSDDIERLKCQAIYDYIDGLEKDPIKSKDKEMLLEFFKYCPKKKQLSEEYGVSYKRMNRILKKSFQQVRDHFKELDL